VIPFVIFHSQNLTQCVPIVNQKGQGKRDSYLRAVASPKPPKNLPSQGYGETSPPPLKLLRDKPYVIVSPHTAYVSRRSFGEGGSLRKGLPCGDSRKLKFTSRYLSDCQNIQWHEERTIQRRHLLSPLSSDSTGGYVPSECCDLTPIFPYALFIILTYNLMYPIMALLVVDESYSSTFRQSQRLHTQS